MWHTPRQLEPSIQRLKHWIIASRLEHVDETGISVKGLLRYSLCGAHLLRDCLFVAEQEKQPWAQAMYELLLQMNETAEVFRVR